MKMRRGFISNSSSSSFVIVSPATIFDQKLNSTHPFIQYIINLSKPSKHTVQNVEMTCAHSYIHTEDDWRAEEYTGEIPAGYGWNNKMTSTEAWEKFMALFKSDEAVTVREHY